MNAILKSFKLYENSKLFRNILWSVSNSRNLGTDHPK
jgi:hypothetical protein